MIRLTTRRVLLAITAALLCVCVSLVAAALVTPAEHEVSATASFEMSTSELWEAITDVEAMPRWRREVDRIDGFAPGSPWVGTGWLERGPHGVVPYRVVEAEPPSPGRPARLVVQIDSDRLGYRGSWTYQLLENADGGSTPHLTEHGEVTNLVFRALSGFSSKTATMERFLEDLHDLQSSNLAAPTG